MGADQPPSVVGTPRARVTELLQQRDCTIKSTNPALQTLIDVVATLHRLGQDECVALLDCDVSAAAHVADAEIKTISHRTHRCRLHRRRRHHRNRARRRPPERTTQTCA